MFKRFLLPIVLIQFALIVNFSSLTFAETSEQERRLRALEAKAGARIELLTILERFTWYGDFRLRYQNQQVDEAGSNTLDRDRFPLRFRLGATIHMYEDMDIGFRMGTGGLTARNSGNSTLDSTFSNKALDLTRAFFKWTPDQFTIEGGKYSAPFMKSSLLWDSDINVEGVSEQYSHKIRDTHLQLTLGQFMVDEINPGEDIILYAYQGIIEQDTQLGKVKVALAYYDFSNHEDPNSVSAAGGSNNTGSEVKILDVIAQWSEKINGKNLTLFGEYAKNTGDLASGQADLDTAWDVGIRYGKSGKKFGDWELGYNYRVVQTEAVFEPFMDSNTNLGTTNFRGYKISGALGLRKGIKVKTSYYNTRVERGTKNDISIFQTDLMFKF
jgi:hypothetical protein